jgi:hypothetical protein
MSVYTVLSEVPQPALRAAIEREFPEKFYHWSDTVSFIQATGTAQTVAIKLGIKSRNDAGGIIDGIDQSVVMQASPAYYGWSKSTLWEWLKTSLEADS